MKANNIATIVEDSTEFSQPYLRNTHRRYRIHIDNGLTYIIISLILFNLTDILIAFS